jgi:hypothetical protein
VTPGAGLFLGGRAGGGLREAAFLAAVLLDHFGFFFGLLFARAERFGARAFVAAAFFPGRVFVAIKHLPVTA